ncbi:MAG: NADPH:quinone reductase [Gemmatimonadota bacterium]|nr:NADPH:quinone reductase [Gemmatimonadota bacterium]
MEAIWYERTGPASDVLEHGELPDPVAGPGEVVVRVAASGVNPSDTKRRGGWIGLRMPHPRIVPHSDGGGTIVSVGPGTPGERAGERVWVWNAQGPDRPFGTAAGLVVVPTGQAVVLPDRVGFDVAAGLGVPGCTAHYAVFGDGPVAGKRLLVQGGAGAVGHLTVQLAKLGGAHVIATVSSPRKAEVARAGGADAVIDYRTEDVGARILDETDGAGVDRVIEVDLAANLETDVAVLATHGRIVSYSSTSDPSPRVDYYPLAFRDVRIHFLQGYLLPRSARAAAIADLTRWLADGRLDVRVGARFRLAETAAAHEALEGRGVIGKIVVEVDANRGDV